MVASGTRHVAACACCLWLVLLSVAVVTVCEGESHAYRNPTASTTLARRRLHSTAAAPTQAPDAAGVVCPLDYNITELEQLVLLFPQPPKGLPPPSVPQATIPNPCSTYTQYTMSKNLRKNGQFFLPASVALACITDLYNVLVLQLGLNEQALCPITAVNSTSFAIWPDKACHFESASSLLVNLSAIADACQGDLIYEVEQCSICGKRVVAEAASAGLDCLMATQIYYGSRISSYERWLQVYSCIAKESGAGVGLNFSSIYPGAPKIDYNLPPSTPSTGNSSLPANGPLPNPPGSQATVTSGTVDRKNSSWRQPVIGASVGVAFLLIAAGAILFAYRQHIASGGDGDDPSVYRASPPTNVVQLPKGARLVGDSPSVCLRLYSMSTLVSATNNFADSNRIGKGGSAEVFRGILLGGKVVAVKKMSRGVVQADASFLNELSVISSISHPNLVALEGYCKCNNGEFLLVYDFMPNGTLEEALFKPAYPFKLSWEQWRYIILDSARGLDYLHSWNNSQGTRIIHRDVKLANILLDGQFHARLTDFGIARRMNHEQTHITTKVLGTFGYLAPEYASTGWLTEKSDTYSFGVVMLAIITRQQVIRTESSTRGGLVAEAFTAAREGRLMEMVSPVYTGEYTRFQLERFLSVSLLCLQDDPSTRPTMSEIINMLEGRVEVPAIYIPVPSSMTLVNGKSVDMGFVAGSGGYDTGSSSQSQPHSTSSSSMDMIGELPSSSSIEFDNRHDVALNMENIPKQTNAADLPAREIQRWPSSSTFMEGRRGINDNKIDLR